MTKKIIALLAMAAATASPLYARSDNPTSRPDHWAIEFRDASGVSTEAVVVDFDGDFRPGYNLQQDLGESSRSWKNVYSGALTVSSGLVGVHESFVGISTSVQNGYRALGFTVSTASVQNGSSNYFTADLIQSSGAPRNIIVGSSVPNVTATVQSTTTINGAVTFWGYDASGANISESISFSTINVWAQSTWTLTGVGNVAFAQVSSMSIVVSSYSLTQSSTLWTLNVGWGNKFGLANRISNTADVYKITLVGQDVTTNSSVGVNTTNSTIVLPVAPNNVDDYEVWYRTYRSLTQNPVH